MNTGLTVFHNYKDKIMSSGNRKWTDTAKQCGLSFHDVQLHMMIMHIIFSYSPLLFRKKKKCKKLFSLRKYTKKKEEKKHMSRTRSNTFWNAWPQTLYRRWLVLLCAVWATWKRFLLQLSYLQHGRAPGTVLWKNDHFSLWLSFTFFFLFTPNRSFSL